MKNKIFETFAEAVSDIPDGAIIMCHSFVGPSGVAQNLILALRNHGAKDLTMITPNLGAIPGSQSLGFKPYHSLHLLVNNGQIKKALLGYIIGFPEGVKAVEMVPQGILAERIRAGGAGLGGFYSPVGVGTIISEGKETRIINGKKYVFETPLRADYAFIRARKADNYGNLVYRLTSRSFNPIMATAADTCIAEVDEIVETGELDPEQIVTPGCLIDRIVRIR